MIMKNKLLYSVSLLSVICAILTSCNKDPEYFSLPYNDDEMHVRCSVEEIVLDKGMGGQVAVTFSWDRATSPVSPDDEVTYKLCIYPSSQKDQKSAYIDAGTNLSLTLTHDELNDVASWTVENGRYPGNWLGLWTPANGYRDGEEIACNKTGNDIAHLQLFAIGKKRFHADYIPADAEKDVTPLMVNPQFTGNGFGWTMTGTWGNQRYNGAVEVWHSTNFHFTQTLEGLPDGFYTVTCQMANGEGKNTGYLYATSAGSTATATVEQSCAGSNFDAQRDKMNASETYGLLSVDINVSGGTLTLGIREPSAGNTWLVWDNFTLTYRGPVDTGIQPATNPTPCPSPKERGEREAIYDLSGRKLPEGSNAAKFQSNVRGRILIINGKKYIQ